MIIGHLCVEAQAWSVDSLDGRLMVIIIGHLCVEAQAWSVDTLSCLMVIIIGHLCVEAQAWSVDSLDGHTELPHGHHYRTPMCRGIGLECR